MKSFNHFVDSNMFKKNTNYVKYGIIQKTCCHALIPQYYGTYHISEEFLESTYHP